MDDNLRLNDEFYVGYAPHLPMRLKRWMVRIVVGLNALALALVLVLIAGQQPFARATFEYGKHREFAGILEEGPYPALLVERPGTRELSRYLLVGTGKHGAAKEVRGRAGEFVRLRGSLIYRDNQAMIELVEGTIARVGHAAPNIIQGREMGDVQLTGEIVDSKCFLGVMNPGRSKVHRDCAVRCISGGVPPMLVTNDLMYLLVGSDSRAVNGEILDLIGETLEIEGTAARSGETLILKADPETFRRVKKSLPMQE